MARTKKKIVKKVGKKNPFAAILGDYKEGEREYKIIEASIEDEKCNYVFQVIHGKKLGEKHTVKGPLIAMKSLFESMSKFNVHLAVLDDAYKLSDVQIGDIDRCHNEEITLKYQTNGFKIKGIGENETIELIGTKYSQTAVGRMAIATPKISMSKLSHYKWWNELKAASNNAREEVALYNEGNGTPVNIDDEEEQDNPAQLEITSHVDEKPLEPVVDNGEFDEPF